MKIVVLDGKTLNPRDITWDAIESLGELTVYDRTAPADVIARIGDAEAVYTNKTIIDAAVIEKCPNMKFIGVLATGYNVVDIKAACAAGITVSNIPSYGSHAVAQFAIALLLELCHHAGDHSLSVKAGDWGRSGEWCYWNYPMMELLDKTIGIIGFGNIGQKVGHIAQAFGMKVIAYGYREKTEPESEQLHYTESLDELLGASDVISLHCPLFPDTEKMINAASIAKMKDGVKIINTSRGPLIDEQALADALKSGKVSGAAMDVTVKEPVNDDCPLLTAPNTIITPHIAWAPKETRARLMQMAADNLAAFQSGEAVNVIKG